LSTAAAGNNRQVSLPIRPAKHAYLAYGEQPADQTPQQQMPVFRATLQAAR
jgi:hypothetical protein